MKISVTEEDISSATRGDGYFCPVALAIKKHLSLTGRASVCVFYDSVLIKCPNFIRDEKVTLPKRVSFFISRFDAKREVRPFTFNLDFTYEN